MTSINEKKIQYLAHKQVHVCTTTIVQGHALKQKAYRSKVIWQAVSCDGVFPQAQFRELRQTPHPEWKVCQHVFTSIKFLQGVLRRARHRKSPEFIIGNVHTHKPFQL